MHLFQALILGVVEGITEFLPISSTGHLILAAHFLGLAETDFLKNFEIIIQFGAILSIVVLYWRRFFQSWQTLKKLFVAFLPTAILGLIFYKAVKAALGDTNLVIWSLFLGGVFIIIFEYWYSRSVVRAHVATTPSIDSISYKQAFAVGLFQSIALIPGVSRSAATIIGGLIVKIERRVIVEFSFLLAVPTMLAATGLDLVKNIHSFSSDQFSLLFVGFVTSFIVAMVAVVSFIKFIQKHTFIGFGVYRVILALVLWFLVF